MLGYIKYQGESIATNGAFHVGTVKTAAGTWAIPTVRTFLTLDEAKAFIDAGKPATDQEFFMSHELTTRVWQAPDRSFKNIEYREGQEAYADGVDGYAAKPYADGTQEMIDWFVGWLDARKQDQAEEGEA